MAIYTQYGRYLKAKMFKEALESRGTTYMLLGLGNPQWDATSAQEMPVAPYDLSSVSSDGQFNDPYVSQWFQTNDSLIDAWHNGGQGTNAGNVGPYLEECQYLQPIFPAIWQPSENDRMIFSTINNFTQSNYQTGYITEQDGAYTLYFDEAPGGLSIDFNTLTDLEKQYFADLYLRGKARSITISGGTLDNRLPVGLLGAVRCNIEFVKDIGFDDSHYTGSIDEFWYGDRYWKIVRPDDDAVIEDYVSTEDESQRIFPHHLLINATLNPRTLCGDNLIIDQVIVPRHIAIFTKKNEDDSTPPRYYRAYENVFNFGQYNEEEYESIDSVTNNGVTGTKLGFTLKTHQQDTEYSTPKGEFTFWLHDYIHGQIRETHSIDRIGYVIGF